MEQPNPVNRGRAVPLIYSGIALEAGLGIVAVVLGYFVGHNPLAGLTFTPTSVLQALLACVPPLLGLAYIRRSDKASLKRLLGEARRVVERFLTPLTWPKLLLLSLAAGFGEEVLFRGLIQSLAALRFGTPVAIFSSSVVFAFLHIVTKTYAVYAFLFSVYLGTIYAATGNILVPILCHAIYDAVALRLTARDITAQKDPIHQAE